jgi:uncharacterized membrane protein
MLFYLTAYVATTIIFLAADAVWLGVVAKKYYAAQLGHLMRPDINMGVAAVFYLFYTIGIVVFAIKPAYAAQNMWHALGYGALFGLLAYGTYDITNMATLKDWPIKMSLIDMAWGTCLTGFAALAGYIITQKIVPFSN